MSETLSIDNTTPDQPELNADEQESLAIGEGMVKEQESLLAGKYDSPAALEKAYLELQQKLGEQTDDEESEDSEEAEESEQTYDEDEEVGEGLDDEDVAALQDMAGGEEQYGDRKSTRLTPVTPTSYAVFCLKKKM